MDIALDKHFSYAPNELLDIVIYALYLKYAIVDVVDVSRVYDNTLHKHTHSKLHAQHMRA